MFKNLAKFFIKPISYNSGINLTFQWVNLKKFAVANAKKTGRKRAPSKNSIKIAHHNPLVEVNEISPEVREQIREASSINIKSNILHDNVMERADAHNYMKLLDSSFEGFFFKREFNLKNFNYYLQVLVRQDKISQCEEALVKMQELGITPDEQSYIHLLTVYAKNKDIENSERVFEIMESKYIPNKIAYNSLLLAYAKNRRTAESEAIIREMKEKGIKPDIICYTTLIHAFNLSKQYNKCFELYDDACMDNELDEFILSYMIRICANIKNVSKALFYWDTMEMLGFTNNIMNYNSLLKALSCKPEYAQRTLDEFMKIKAKGVKPDRHTYSYVIKSCTHYGDIETANNTLKEMKLMDIKVNTYICNDLMRVYAGACKQPFVKEEHIDKYIKDSWDILKYMENEKIPIDLYTLNSLLLVHSSAHKLDLVEGLVVPLYEKFGIPMDNYTYEHIIRMLLDLREYLSVFNLYDKLKAKDLVPTNYILNSIVEAGIRANKVDFIVEGLQRFKEIKDTPEPRLLRLLSNLDEVPDRLYVEMKDWVNYNTLAKRREFKPAVFTERDKRTAGFMKHRRGRRHTKHKR
jgi:pentatricopeptide repeat protein